MKKIVTGTVLIAIVVCLVIIGYLHREPKVSLNYDNWLSKHCGKCHKKSEFHYILTETSTMTRREFQGLLPGMVHGDFRMDEKDIKEVLDYLEANHMLKKDNPPPPSDSE